MPKRKKVYKVNSVVFKDKVPHKFRIGTRKSGISAHLLSTDKLKEYLNSKWSNAARTVLVLRGEY